MNYQTKKPWTFYWQISIECIILGGSLGYLVSFFPELSRYPEIDLPPIVFCLLLIIAAPVIETFLFQSIPISFLRKRNVSINYQIIVSTLLFSSVHIQEYYLTGAVSGIIGGFYLSFSYAIWRKNQPKLAYLMTAAIHMTYNTFILLLEVIFNGLWKILGIR